MMRKVLIITCILLFSVKTYSQNENGHNLYLEPALRVGRIIPNASNSSFLWNVTLYSLELRLGKQTTGELPWHRLFNYPEFGIAARYGHFDDDMFGDKFAVFAFMNGTIYRNNRFTLHYQFGAGIVYWSKYYDMIKYPINRYIGSHLNAHIDLALGIDYRISPQTALTLRANFSHSSNAALCLPNMGINPISAALGVKCYFHKQKELPFSFDVEDTAFVKKNSFYVAISAGARQSKKDAPENSYKVEPYYLGTVLQLGYFHQFSPKFRYGGGFDLIYSGELKTHLPAEQQKTGKYFSEAAFLAFEVIYNRFVFHTSFAVYLNRSFNFYTPYYQRVGFRFLLGKNKNHFVGATVKAHAGSVDYLEWTYGCCFVNYYK
ncbi:MAG TPA: acyloxyacyl hydrolase [Bacteroidales bacterium]|jgi:hypothetical protein|nr:acyloxyacyl hydrolase [Bacteroidales bacterium]HNW67290.1 acyloxyacyl hydrolase [Bacteroidales bacterium]